MRKLWRVLDWMTFVGSATVVPVHLASGQYRLALCDAVLIVYASRCLWPNWMEHNGGA